MFGGGRKKKKYLNKKKKKGGEKRGGGGGGGGWGGGGEGGKAGDRFLAETIEVLRIRKDRKRRRQISVKKGLNAGGEWIAYTVSHARKPFCPV